MSTRSVLAPGCRETPYWWDDASSPTLPEGELPARVDVAVVGSGYTGLNAALALVPEAAFFAAPRNPGDRIGLTWDETQLHRLKS